MSVNLQTGGISIMTSREETAKITEETVQRETIDLSLDLVDTNVSTGQSEDVSDEKPVYLGTDVSFGDFFGDVRLVDAVAVDEEERTKQVEKLSGSSVLEKSTDENDPLGFETYQSGEKIILSEHGFNLQLMSKSAAGSRGTKFLCEVEIERPEDLSVFSHVVVSMMIPMAIGEFFSTKAFSVYEEGGSKSPIDFTTSTEDATYYMSSLTQAKLFDKLV